MIRIFAGFDPREAVGFHAFVQSVLERTSAPVSLTPIGGTEGQRDGTNAFTYSRFLVPWLCDFQGFAIWCDGADMLALGDLAELWAVRSGWHAVQVVKHSYRTKHPRKYVGTAMEADNVDYPRKNWSSVILWDCGHYMNRVLTPEYVAEHEGAHLHRFAWIPDERIGELSGEWNHLVGEQPFNAGAKLVHFTVGIPGFKRYARSEYVDEWQAAVSRAQRGIA
jgi:hypothetical protein